MVYDRKSWTLLVSLCGVAMLGTRELTPVCPATDQVAVGNLSAKGAYLLVQAPSTMCRLQCGYRSIVDDEGSFPTLGGVLCSLVGAECSIQSGATGI